MKLSHLLLILTLVIGNKICFGLELSDANSATIDKIVQTQIDECRIPGAVVCIGDQNKVCFLKAYGNKSLKPQIAPAKTDTIYDIASLTKPVATATAIHILANRKKISLDDKVCKYLPSFAQNGKEAVTITNLLLHNSGLPAYTSVSKEIKENGSPCPNAVFAKICSLKLNSKPGEKFAYSCLGYITLCKVVEAVSGKQFDKFVSENIFEPLCMNDSSFNPNDSLKSRIAPTTLKHDKWLVGKVHDPLASAMGGVSGNAGVFTTAKDLSVFCRMILNNGKLNGKRFLSKSSVESMTKVNCFGRAKGFDVNSKYAWIKGKRASVKVFGHSGFTGTSIVCDPDNKIFIIILANRVHPNGKGSVGDLRKGIADTVFGSL